MSLKCRTYTCYSLVSLLLLWLQVVRNFSIIASIRPSFVEITLLNGCINSTRPIDQNIKARLSAVK